MLACCLALFGLLIQAAPPQPQVPTFRASTTIVPVDVRVLDRSGNPVAGLTRDDFTIVEDGVAQIVTQFSVLAYPIDAAGDRTADRTGSTSDPAPHRTFLLVLGRGRLQGPSRGFDAVESFIRRRLSPRDQVAVVAYDRITDLTADHETILRLLRRYREKHEEIEALLDHWFSGLAAHFSKTGSPPGIQRRVEMLFASAGAVRTRRLVALAAPGQGDFERDRARAFDVLDPSDADTNSVYMAALQDVEKLYAAVEFLRAVDGEKHIVFVSEEGLVGAGADALDRLSAMAADARVTISPVHTGGLPTSWSSSGAAMALEGPSWQHRWANASSRTIAERTGGTAAIFEYADAPLDRLERSTRLSYVLGYTPLKPLGDGARRTIQVRVNRPGAQVVHRTAYYANAASKPYDRRDFLAGSRLAAASAYGLPVTDLRLEMDAELVPGPPKTYRLRAQLRLAAANLRFHETDGTHAAALDFGLFVSSKGGATGEQRQRLDLKLSPADFRKLQDEGITVTLTVDLPERPTLVKAVAYDYFGDKIGSIFRELR